MQKKDVTPDSDKKQNGLFKKFGIGLVGGLLGGALAFGGAYAIMGQNSPSSNSPTTTSTVKNNKGDTKVTNVNLDVNSDVTKAVDKVKDSVVSVINLQSPSQNSDASGFGSIFGGNDGNGSNNAESDGSDLQAASEGSGVIYKKDGKTAYIVTNNHVVDQAKGLEVVLHDGTKVKGELVGTDSYTDLAVIKISSDKVDSIAEFGNSDNLKIGEPALAIGSPLGSAYANSVTQGIISSVNRNIQNENNGQAININAIQTDAAINPGNSGGPLVNIEGQVVGINSVKIVQSESQVSVEGMGFAIPSNDVVNIINQLEKEGKVTRPALGITMEELTNVSTQQRKEILKLPESVQMGVLVRSVQTATPADKAGLERYDVITKIDDKEINSVTDLQSTLYKKKVGEKMKITFYRDGKEQNVNVELTIDQSALKQNSSNSNNSQNP
ncbi:S1C family serine protease [Enterococcus caccae]|uniref:Serine protease DO n=1 Tax=Enterococcus caccae ATCC BAA-1240 TaxID=1158612 RepID=R3WAQ4_9ENTE|nr:trypsin-like peptidase domain-containing protein [Enterococcus caccae]EOL44517.1 serine protease DO [Enterococcus caccae ATCC BAA-1240]EOT58660.1 serine protease DO [Enterococcus caccae ATCC BAA-1240]OJG23371.1 serine protease DO [Enterococcus caccae]